MNNSQFPTAYNNTGLLDQEDIQRSFITRVYAWMTFGLLITAGAALVTAGNSVVMSAIISNPILLFGLMGGELLMVVVLSAAINKLSPALAGLIFVGYAMLNGVTLAFLLLIYTGTSIAITFGITACTFGIMTLYGYTTHRDLTKLGSLLMMALIGLIITSVVNIFIASTALYWVISYVGILIFVGLIAYDTQKLKRMSLALDEESAKKASILGALSLYLDFINLFLMLLRIFGRRR